jgi:hypothetical protein
MQVQGLYLVRLVRPVSCGSQLCPGCPGLAGSCASLHSSSKNTVNTLQPN